jgi:hypothetical protein
MNSANHNNYQEVIMNSAANNVNTNKKFNNKFYKLEESWDNLSTDKKSEIGEKTKKALHLIKNLIITKAYDKYNYKYFQYKLKRSQDQVKRYFDEFNEAGLGTIKFCRSFIHSNNKKYRDTLSFELTEKGIDELRLRGIHSPHSFAASIHRASYIIDRNKIDIKTDIVKPNIKTDIDIDIVDIDMSEKTFFEKEKTKSKDKISLDFWKEKQNQQEILESQENLEDHEEECDDGLGYFQYLSQSNPNKVDMSQFQNISNIVKERIESRKTVTQPTLTIVNSKKEENRICTYTEPPKIEVPVTNSYRMYLRDYKLTPQTFDELRKLSNKPHFNNDRIAAVIRNIVNKKPDTQIFGRRTAFTNFVVKALNNEHEYTAKAKAFSINDIQLKEWEEAVYRVQNQTVTWG